jgi:two-component system phosphate regulon response regulator PhoB
MGSHRVLIVEDDRAIVELLVHNLKAAGFDVSIAYDGLDGLTQAQTRVPDLVILDVGLPVLDGIEVCRRLRSDTRLQETTVMMLTARDDETDELIGFAVGADDYVTKPFSVKSLLGRIRALLRRSSDLPMSGEIVTSQGLSVDRSRYRVIVDGAPLRLTRSEFHLLDAMIRQPGRVFRRCELIDIALGSDAIVMDRTIDVHIRAIRRKLGPKSALIETMRGVGYRFRDAGQLASETG